MVVHSGRRVERAVIIHAFFAKLLVGACYRILAAARFILRVCHSHAFRSASLEQLSARMRADTLSLPAQQRLYTIRRARAICESLSLLVCVKFLADG